MRNEAVDYINFMVNSLYRKTQDFGNILKMVQHGVNIKFPENDRMLTYARAQEAFNEVNKKH